MPVSLWVYSGFESSRVIRSLEQNRERVRIQVWSPLWFRIGDVVVEAAVVLGLAYTVTL